jgi:AhpD family alkylhydroperoxidase
MQNDPELQAETERRLKMIEEALGKIPVVNQILSRRPDLFIPTNDVSVSLFMNKGAFDEKTRHLLALSAAAANGSPYCIRAQMEDAIHFGATDDEIIETLQISAYMGMTKVQSTAFRVYDEFFPEEK